MHSPDGSRYIVIVDAICGRGQKFLKDQIVTGDDLNGYLLQLLKAEAIQKVADEAIQTPTPESQTSLL